MQIKKDKQVNIRLPKELVDLATKEARKTGENLSEWIRRLIIERVYK